MTLGTRSLFVPATSKVGSREPRRLPVTVHFSSTCQTRQIGMVLVIACPICYCDQTIQKQARILRCGERIILVSAKAMIVQTDGFTFRSCHVSALYRQNDTFEARQRLVLPHMSSALLEPQVRYPGCAFALPGSAY